TGSLPDQWKRAGMHLASGLPNFNHHHDEQGRRFCPHTRLAERLVGAGEAVARESGPRTPAPLLSPLLTATQTQWPGLRGTWSMEERDAPIGTKPYHFVLLRLALGNGSLATGVVAFASRH